MSKWTKLRHYLNPVHAAEKVVEELNDIFGTDPGGPSGVPNFEDGHGLANVANISTNTLTGPEEQKIMTTAYMENGGNQNMFGNNTAYNEEPQQDKTWLERNSDWLIPAVTSLLTTGAGIYYNNKQQDKQNNFNAEQAQINRDYQTEMANTAHQREMADLLATGINPVNTATGGGGANTPTGSAATGTSPAYADSIANSALSLAETMKVLNENKYIDKEKKTQIGNVAADTVLKSAQTQQSTAETAKAEEMIKNIDADTKKKLKEAGYTEQMTINAIKEYNLIIEQIENTKSDTDVKKAEAEIKAWEARHPIIARTLQAIGGVAGGVVGGAAVTGTKNILTPKKQKIGF